MNSAFINLLAMATPPGGEGGFLGSPLILFGVIILIFYFMIIRPQQKRMKEHQNLIAGIKRGDKVVLSNGMHGTVHEVEEKTVLIEVAKNTVIRFEKGSVQTVVAAS